MLDHSAEGLSLQQRFSYSWRDVILYNLSVGAGFDELNFVYEKNLKAIPTFATMPCAATFGTEPYSEVPLMPTVLIPDLKTAGTVHMEHELIIEKPIALNATLNIEKVISKVYDRGAGKGAMIVVDIIAKDDAGEVCFTNRMSYLNRWYDGFGGEPAPKTPNPIPEREADLVIDGRFAENTPLLYRMTGDTYAIHADPTVAKAAGFNGPIIHGLCSMGYACRLIVDRCFDGEAEKIRTMKTQFRNLTYPGDAFHLAVWKLDDGAVAFRMLNDQGKPILERGYIG